MNRAPSVAAAIVPLLALSWCVGCASPEASLRARSVFLPGADPDAVFDAARELLRRDFGTVQVNRSTRTIESGPSEFTTRTDSGTVRDLYGGVSRMRRRATMWVLPRENGTLARLRIVIEREDTERTSAVPRQDYRLADWPAAQTAIDRDAATSAEQNEVWTFVRRDLRGEQRVLDALASRFPAPPTTAPSGP